MGVVDLLQNRKNHQRYIVVLSAVKLVVAHGALESSILSVYGMEVSMEAVRSSLFYMLGFFLVWDFLHVLPYYQGLWAEKMQKTASDRYNLNFETPEDEYRHHEHAYHKQEYEGFVGRPLIIRQELNIKAKTFIEHFITHSSPLYPLLFGILAISAPNPISELMFSTT